MTILEVQMIGSRAGFLTAALLFAAGTAEAQQPRSDRDGVFDGRIPVITDTRGRVGRVEDPRLYFARERNKCERHAARANWWRARGGKNADKHALREAQKAERCFDRLFAKQQKRALRDARVARRNPDGVFRTDSRGRIDSRGNLGRGNGNRGRGRGNR
jgi:hypothetical protein